MTQSGLLEVHRIVQFSLHLKGLKKLLQVRNEVDKCGYDEHGDENTASPVCWCDVTITHGTHGNHDKVIGIKEGEVIVDVDTKEVVKYTYPVRE